MARSSRRRRVDHALVYGPVLLFVAALGGYGYRALGMPGSSYRGPLEPLSPVQQELAERARQDVVELAGEIGERNIARRDALERAARYLEQELAEAGYRTERDAYPVGDHNVANVYAERKGDPSNDEIVIIGAHYDSAIGTAGADDNASGVAALLALARRFANEKPRRTLRFVGFVNEEMPHFQTPTMGSFVNAQRARERGERITAMLSLEALGHYTDAEGSQRYPAPLGWFFPSRGDFVAFVGNTESRDLVRTAIGAFRNSVKFPSEGAALPATVPGVSWSDHSSFWQAGYPALMVTDTALMRYPHYHTPNDTPDKLDYERLARVIDGLGEVVAALSR
jgi:hypothetical protein